MNRLSGKRIVITGAASGIGRASTLLFVKEGAQVLAVDQDSKALDRLAEETLTPIRQFVADCGAESEVEAMIQAAATEWGGVDVVFANAGISGGGVPFLEQTGEQWNRVLQTNLMGAFYAVKFGALAMMNQGGSIICTASVAGLRANAAGAPYSASKAGIINLVQTAANALSGTGIRVNAVGPGLIETGMTQALFDVARARGSEQKIGQLNPLGRAGRPDEVAQAALFLASDESSYVNGQVLIVDGGLASTHPYRKGSDRF